MMKTALLRGLLSVLSPAGPRGKLTIFQFHRVPAATDPIAPSEMARAQFERVLDFLTDSTRVLPLSEAMTAMTRGNLPDRAVALTFDDGYAEWVQVVSPILRRRKLTATFFVTTEQLSGGAMWHERINAAVGALPDQGAELPYGFAGFRELAELDSRVRLARELQERLKYMPLAQRIVAIEGLEAQAVRALGEPLVFDESSVRQLHADGFEIGAHTLHHPILNETTDVEARNEIGGAKEILEGIVRAKVDLFAYPNGRPGRDFSNRHVEMVRACGYRGAVITGGGAADQSTDPFQLPRFTPWGEDATRMALQMARNLKTRPPVTSSLQPAQRKASVLFVENGSGFGGAVVALQTLLRHLPADGFTFHVVTNLPVGEIPQIPSVSSHRVIADRFVNTRELAQRIKAAGLGPRLTYLMLFLIGRLDDVVNRLPYLSRLLLHARRLNLDIIHGNNEPAANREAMVVAQLLGKRYVQHVRGPTTSSRHTPWLLQKPALFIPVSRWLADEMLRLDVEGFRIRQIYDAVEIARPGSRGRGALRRELGLDEDVVVVAMIGMLLAWKGQDQFIEAVTKVQLAHTKVAWLVIGGVPEREDPAYEVMLKQRVLDLGVSDRVFFTGQRNDLATLLPQIDVVVSASTEPEPLGLVMLEAMTNGCVFVGPAHGAATEVVADGSNGFLFTPRSPVSMAESLTRAVQAATDPASDLRDKARASVQERFSGARCADETSRLHLYLAFGTAIHP